MNLKKVVCGLFVLAGLLMVMSCTVGQEETDPDPGLQIDPPGVDDSDAGPVGPPGEMEYWEHTVTASESSHQDLDLYYITIFVTVHPL